MTKGFFKIDQAKATLFCAGNWTLKELMDLKNAIAKLQLPANLQFIDGNAIGQMDSSGALVLQQLLETQTGSGRVIQPTAFKKEHTDLLTLISQPNKEWMNIPPIKKPNTLIKLGMISVNHFKESMQFYSFIGEMTVDFVRLLLNPWRIPFRECISAVEVTGVYALPIIALLSFLIGVVLAYQMGLQLRNYGANIYIVDLLGLSILREFSPLITAIIVAGRTGSAFTAQLGTMKIREEIDALRTMGISPNDLLIIPRIIAMMLVLPLLTIWSSVFGIIGGMIISKSMLHISYLDFLTRFKEAISFHSYYSGMIKAPIFGYIIATIGCYRGMQVSGSASSVGQKTTTSVVQSIFFIIVADALFSIVFARFNI